MLGHHLITLETTFPMIWQGTFNPTAGGSKRYVHTVCLMLATLALQAKQKGTGPNIIFSTEMEDEI
ncbi:hypothetical protein N7491_009288 [Penicillium cf. griseofulvum]|uniref:Uncharacterized protein n=1 Tax=Penicillium cf. griseofulvum TaxID=2972120 RepID=A0A9W9MEW2_9EURO|nr:hypothetical protein N7472_005119 [Penicillium cf. griseofulvum]KAJ5424072.1 hypothetical protein N7491_009288 [Penicillium cf. griseofulvum]KAJ5442688.1 hypothetical protein N7445_005695 [Penicillium cf. griseofulvum]